MKKSALNVGHCSAQWTNLGVFCSITAVHVYIGKIIVLFFSSPVLSVLAFGQLVTKMCKKNLNDTFPIHGPQTNVITYQSVEHGS